MEHPSKRKNRLSITSNYDDIVWADVIPVLMAFAMKLMGSQYDKLEKSKEEYAYDFSLEAITRYLEKPGQFDPSRHPDLIKYLQYNILRSLISRAKTTGDVPRQSYMVNNDGENPYEQSISIESLTSSELDVKTIIDQLKASLSDELLEIFNLRYEKEYSRAEICESLDLPERDYDNRMKKIKRAFKKIINNYQL